MALHLIDRVVVEDEGEGDAVVCVTAWAAAATASTR